MALNVILWPGAANPNNVILRGEAASTQSISPTGITSLEAFGTPIVLAGAVLLQIIGIASSEAFGTPTLSSGSVTPITPQTLVTDAACYICLGATLPEGMYLVLLSNIVSE